MRYVRGCERPSARRVDARLLQEAPAELAHEQHGLWTARLREGERRSACDVANKERGRVGGSETDHRLAVRHRGQLDVAVALEVREDGRAEA